MSSRSPGRFVTDRLRRGARAALIATTALAIPVAGAVPIDWDAGTGDWFDLNNWNPTQVPVGFGGGSAGDDASINNAGTALADVATVGPGNPARTRTLSVGAGDASGMLSGTFESSGVDLETAFGLRVGVASDATTNATGQVSVTGAAIDATGTSVQIGRVASTTGAASAAGTVLVSAGDLPASVTSVGTISFDLLATAPSPAATATGVLDVTGNVSSAVQAGVNFAGAPGTVAQGDVHVRGGDLSVSNSQGLVAGSTAAPLDDALGAGSAQGNITVHDGVLRTPNTADEFFAPRVVVGSAAGGLAAGVVETPALDMAGGGFRSISVGVASRGGDADGRFTSLSGDAAVHDEVRVGFTDARTGGTAVGVLDLGSGALISIAGDQEGTFALGNTRSPGLFNNLGVGTAHGEMSAGGLHGFRSYRVGVGEGTFQFADNEATGILNVGGGGISGRADGDSVLFIGASFGTPNNSQINGPGGTADGHVQVSGGGITGMSNVLVGVSEAAPGNVGSGFGTATGRLDVVGDVQSRALAVGRAQHTQSSQVRAPDVQPIGMGTMVMRDGTLGLQAPGTGTASLEVGLARSFFSSGSPDPDFPVPVMAAGRLELTNVVVQGNARTVIGNATTPFDDDPAHAEGQVLVTGGSMGLQSLLVGAAQGLQATSQGLLQLTDSALSVADSVNVGSFGAARGELLALRSDVTVGGDLCVGCIRSTIGTADVAETLGVVDVTDADLNVGGALRVGAQFQGGNGELRLNNANAHVDGLIRLAASSNLGSLFGNGTIALTDSTLVGNDGAFFDSGTVILVDSDFSVAGNLHTEFFNASATPPEFVTGASGDVDIHLQRSLLSVGQELALGVDDLLGITIEGETPIAQYGVVDAASVALLGGDLEVVFDLASFIDGMVFDLIVSASIDGIAGDFANVSISGLDPMYSAIAGVVVDDLGAGLVEIYRLQITQAVPTPSTFALMAGGVALVGLCSRRRRRTRQQAPVR